MSDSIQPLSTTQTMVRIAVVTAVACILGPIVVPLPFSPVPISLTQLSIYLAVYALGRRNGTISVALYLLLGAVGLPVFSGFSGGVAKLVGPTGGYLIGFIFLVIIVATAVDRNPHDWKTSAIGMVIGNLVVYFFGTAWLAVSTGMGLWAAALAGVVPYIIFDVIKAVIALVVGPRIRDRI